MDFIGLLRATESSALLHQIIGRLARIHPDKVDGSIFDYAGNIDRHHPDGDLFNPVIKSWNDKKSSEPILAICEQCQVENEFSARQNDDGLGIDDNGYFTDLTGNRIMTEHGPIPGHYGRRCLGLHLINGRHEQCGYRWSHKKCPECGTECDITARYCPNKHELINPNDRLIIDFRARKRDPTQLQCDKVLNWNVIKSLSAKGNECIKVDYITEYRTFTVWYQVRGTYAKAVHDYELFLINTEGFELMPETVTYKKNPKTGFYEVLQYNQPADILEVA